MNVAGLKPHQVGAMRDILAALRTIGGAVDCSDMGTGKTFTSGGVIREMNVGTLVVCPKVSLPGWAKMGKLLGVEFSSSNYEMLRTGRLPYGWWENPRPMVLPSYFECTVCKSHFDPAKPEPCRLHHAGIHCIERKTLPWKHGKFTWHENVGLLVFDEAHRAAALDSLHADMLLAAGRQKIPTLCLSATLADSPLHFKALGYVLRLHNYIERKSSGGPSGFYSWAKGQGCCKLPFGGLHFVPKAELRREILLRLHGSLFPSRGARVRIRDLGESFPQCQVTAELYNLESAGRIEELYERMDEAIRELNGIREGDPAHPLVEMLRARQEVELLKVPIFEELTADAIKEGMHVAIFVNFRATVEELCKRLGTQCRIDGSQIGVAGAKRRQANVEAYLADKEPVIVASNAAGGISIDLADFHGNFPRLGLVSAGYSMREFKQVLGRLPRLGAKTKSLYRVVFTAGTREEKLHKNLATKLDNLDLLNDGDLMAANLPLEKFRERVIEQPNDN